MEKIKYTEEQVRFILDNWIKNENICIKETGHSYGSIKLMLQNIGASYGFCNFSTGNPMYTKIADEYRVDNPKFGEPMTKKSFCVRFDIIKVAANKTVNILSFFVCSNKMTAGTKKKVTTIKLKEYVPMYDKICIN